MDVLKVYRVFTGVRRVNVCLGWVEIAGLEVKGWW